MSEFYAPEHAKGVRWNDPAFGIQWPTDERLISDRDQSYPDFISHEWLKAMAQSMTDENSYASRAGDASVYCRTVPICRSITGDGVRETLRLIEKHIPVEIHEIPSGTKVFDWIVPKEWNIRDAYIKNKKWGACC